MQYLGARHSRAVTLLASRVRADRVAESEAEEQVSAGGLGRSSGGGERWADLRCGSERCLALAGGWALSIVRGSQIS